MLTQTVLTLIATQEPTAQLPQAAAQLPQQTSTLATLTFWVAFLTCAVAFLTLVVTAYVACLEWRAARSRRRVGIVWLTLDESMRVGYEVKEKKPPPEQAWQWHERVARFCKLALGYHAMKLILQETGTLDEIKKKAKEGAAPPDIIQRTLTRIHDHIAGKVLEGRIHPDFNEKRWEGWTPEKDTPE